MPEDKMFVRKASGLVRAWSVYDAALYVFMGLAVVPLAIYSFAMAPFFPGAHLVPATIISALFVVSEVVLYALLIAIMPRAGGDYVWQSRIFGGWVGFVFPIVGWVIVQWHWAPFLGANFNMMGITPLLTVLQGATGSAWFQNAISFMSSNHGVFLAACFIILEGFIWVGLGMKWYARFQRVSFYVAVAGILGMLALLLGNDHSAFVQAFNHYAAKWWGGSGNVYQQVIDAAATGGYAASPWKPMVWAGSMALVPAMAMYNLWPNFGATLYGEIAGATSVKRNFTGMFSGLAASTVLAVIFLWAIARTMGWEFFHAASYLFWVGGSPIPVFPFPGLFAVMLTDSPVLQAVIIIAVIGWLLGWAANLFLSSSRALFAAAFDRVLPEGLAKVTTRLRVPVNCLLVMGTGAFILSILYCYLPGFSTYTFDLTVGVTIMYVVTALAGIVLPYKEKKLYSESPAAKYKVLGVPLITVAGVVFLGYLSYLLYEWVTVAAYGVNNPVSAIYVAAQFVLAIVVYAISRYVRKQQGIRLDMIHKSIPVE